MMHILNEKGAQFGGNFGKALKDLDACVARRRGIDPCPVRTVRRPGAKVVFIMARRDGDNKLDFQEFMDMYRRYPLILHPAFALQNALKEHTLGMAHRRGFLKVPMREYKYKFCAGSTTWQEMLARAAAKAEFARKVEEDRLKVRAALWNPSCAMRSANATRC